MKLIGDCEITTFFSNNFPSRYDLQLITKIGSAEGYVAIDDVIITREPCSQPQVYTCDFNKPVNKQCAFILTKGKQIIILFSFGFVFKQVFSLSHCSMCCTNLQEITCL